MPVLSTVLLPRDKLYFIYSCRKFLSIRTYQHKSNAHNFFYSSPKDMFIDFRERVRERERGRKREGERERERERNIHQLPPKCALMGDLTHNLLVYRTRLQPTESPGQGPTTFV